MPIYAYRCDSCGFAKDVLQKISDAQLTDCPSCETAGTFKKQLTAAGFQLKGSGWYVTDFRGGNSNAAASAPASQPGGGAASGAASEGSGSAAGAAKDSSSTPAPAASSTASSSS